MSKMSYKKSLNNSVKEAGIEGEGFSPSRCLVGKQHRPGCHPATTSRKWSKEDNKMAILCFFASKGSNDPILVIERECISTERTMDCSSWRSNTCHAKLGLF